MEVFTSFKKDLRRIGFLPFDHPYSKLINILQYFVIFGVCIAYITTTLWFLIFETESFNVYIETLVPFLVGIFSLTLYCTLLFKRKRMLELISEFESIIKNSKLI